MAKTHSLTQNPDIVKLLDFLGLMVGEDPDFVVNLIRVDKDTILILPEDPSTSLH